MIKRALMEGFTSAAKNFAKKNPMLAAGVVGSGLGAGMGYGTSQLAAAMNSPAFRQAVDAEAARKNIKIGSKKYKELEAEVARKLARNFTLAGGISYGLMGALLGKQYQDARAYEEAFRRYYQGGGGRSRAYSSRHGFRSGMGSTMDLWKDLGLSGTEKTKAEVMKKWKDLAKQHHPDRGGDAEKMKTINTAMDELRDTDWFQKLSFWKGFQKQASHVAEIVGLGTLAAPSVQALRGKPMNADTAHKTEIAGLGILAAPSVAAMGKKLLRKKVGV